MKKNIFKGFTLVELIIVITILAILSTIAFMSFQNYTKSARDSARLSSIKNIQTGLEIAHEKIGKYPTPDNGLTLTGNTGSYVVQGTLGESVSKILGIQGELKDPLNGKELVYSIFKDGKYYQIASDVENNNLSFINKTYADNLGVMVKGNYNFDPSLPSLITVNGSVSGSGIFDPNVCFVINNGENNLNSTNSNCIKKADMSLKNFDYGLVGYWDMESLTGGKLKDLSGKGNDGTFEGTPLPTSTGGYLGKGYSFSGNYVNLGVTNTGTTFDFTDRYITIISTVSLNKIHDNGWGNSIISSTDSNGFAQRLHTDFIYPDFRINGNFLQLKHYKNISLNTFYNVTTVYNGQEVKSYLNGDIVSISKVSGKLTNRPNGCIFIGADPTGCIYGDIHFNGIIDDLKVYDRALSDEEILQQAKIAGF